MSANLFRVEVPERDGAYLFTRYEDAEAFAEAWNSRDTLGISIWVEGICPLEPGFDVERVIAAERGDALEYLIPAELLPVWQEVPEAIREGRRLFGLIADLTEIPGAGTPGHLALVRVLAEWAEADEKRYASEPEVSEAEKHRSALETIAGGVPTEDEWCSAADFMEVVATTLEWAGIVRPEHYQGDWE